MEYIERRAYAKINLSLNILPERGDRGYYKVRFLNSSISLHDLVRLVRRDKEGISINEPAIDESENIARQAARLMFDTFGLRGGLQITIEKNIPSRAGLGGGSSDAAAVLNGINDLYGLSLSMEQRIELAARLGMDVCYCVVGGLCTVEGIGEVVKPLRLSLPSLNILTATPREKKPSTAWAYSVLELNELGRGTTGLDTLLAAIRRRDVPGLAGHLHNDFEQAVFRHYPVSAALKNRLKELGAVNAVLAGSGLSIFALFEDRTALLAASKALNREGVVCHEARPA
jgi:4-diphosphocytidyl-2-C-methyl-D-erythritol kinase